MSGLVVQKPGEHCMSNLQKLLEIEQFDTTKEMDAHKNRVSESVKNLKKLAKETHTPQDATETLTLKRKKST